MASKRIDYILLGIASAIIIFGIMMLASASAKISPGNNTYYYLNHQLLFGLLPGLVLGFLAYKIRLETLKRWAPWIFIANLVLMALVFAPKIGVSAGGAARWIGVGSVTFQPSELLKLSMIIYLASWLAIRSEKKMQRAKGGDLSRTFLPFLGILLAVGVLLYFQPDISTFTIIAGVSIIMYFLANTPLIHTILLTLGSIGVFLFLAFGETYRQNRLSVFFNSRIDPMGIGYHLKQAMIAVGSGGLFGLGLGMSRQIYGFLPESMSDSIFAILAEETGFFGCLALILLFLIFFWRGFKIGKDSRDNFSKLAALGITSWILIQTLFNISSMTGFFPLAGIPLPYFSYGGSALATEILAIGIMLNISKNN